jgi:hypothetical protein
VVEAEPPRDPDPLREAFKRGRSKRETEDLQQLLGQRQRPRGFDRYVVHFELAADAVLGGFLLAAGLLGPGTLGPSWPWLTFGSLLLAANMFLFFRFAFLCWSRSPDPLPPLGPKGQGNEHRGARTITALLSATVGIILGYTLLYWTAARIIGLPAFYAAVGTLATVNPPSPKTTTANLLLVSQELIDLVFLGGVVTVALGRAFDR